MKNDRVLSGKQYRFVVNYRKADERKPEEIIDHKNMPDIER